MTAKVPRLAVLATAFFPASHADVILSRWKCALPNDHAWGFTGARSEIASLFVEQNSGSLRDEYCQKNAVYAAHDIKDALTLGTGTLAVDGVILIGEHGQFPIDERGVTRYPRKEYFDQILEIFDQSGKVVPIFNDKHFSWNPAWAQEMADRAVEKSIPLLGGSTLSFCRLPAFHISPLTRPVEMLSLFYCGVEVYGYHSIEGALRVLETVKGAQSGIISLEVAKRDAVWRRVHTDTLLQRLFHAALAAALSPPDGPRPAPCAEPVLLTFEHTDHSRNHFLYLENAIKDFTIALSDRGGRISSSRYVLGNSENHFAHFATLNSVIDEFMIRREPPIPTGRCLLATKMIAAAMDALHEGSGGLKRISVAGYF